MAAIGGETLSEVYQSTRKLLLRAGDGIGRLERLASSGSGGGGGLDSPELSFSVKKDISQIHSLCSSMDRLWRSIADKSQRDLWKRKVEQMAEEADSLKDSLDKYSMRSERRATERAKRSYDKEAQERELLRKRKEEEEQLLFESALLCRQRKNRERLKRALGLMSDLCNKVGLPKTTLRRRIKKGNCVTTLIKCGLMVSTFIIIRELLCLSFPP